MRHPARSFRFLGAWPLFALGATCADRLAMATDTDVRMIVASVVTDFFHRMPPEAWPLVFVSDEYSHVPVDSAFMTLLPPVSVPVESGRRGDVWIRYGIVRDGALLLEPGPVHLDSDGVAGVTLSFWSTAEFGGELSYQLKRRRLGVWQIVSMQVNWIV